MIYPVGGSASQRGLDGASAHGQDGRLSAVLGAWRRGVFNLVLWEEKRCTDFRGMMDPAICDEGPRCYHTQICVTHVCRVSF